MPTSFFVAHVAQRLGTTPESIAAALLALSLIVGYVAVRRVLPGARETLFERGIYGIDINKTTPEQRQEFGAAKRAAAAIGGCFPDHLKKYVVPESLGIAVGAVYLGCVLIVVVLVGLHLGKVNAAVSSIAFMLLLGFVDDVLDVRWRHKIILSMLASLPLLTSYDGPTSIVVPIPLRPLVASLAAQLPQHALFNASHILGYTADRASVVIVPLGALYLLYMSLVCVFCTNSINILAGVNGVEVGQSIVIAVAQALYSAVQLARGADKDSGAAEGYWISLAVLVPFIGCSYALYELNRYPSRVFVGDSYTYLAGMVLAVAGISGAYSKTLLLFFLPQLFNFVISLPQLLGFVELPRHRVPRWNPRTNKLENSRNLTILNAILAVTGPLHERTLTNVTLGVQVVCCALAFWVRFTMAGYVYETVM